MYADWKYFKIRYSSILQKPAQKNFESKSGELFVCVCSPSDSFGIQKTAFLIDYIEKPGQMRMIIWDTFRIVL